MAHHFRSAVTRRAALARALAAALPLLLAVTAARAQLAENFDAVVVPALPSSWTTANFGFSWTTTTDTPHTPPNCAAAMGLAVVSEAYLDSTLINIPGTTHLVRFRHRFLLQADPEDVGFDGGVLEIAIGPGDYQDIIAAGGEFLAGGYTRTISNQTDSLIGGRAAWSGDSGGYLSTSVRLPPSTLDSTIRLRFRLSCDNDTDGGVWAIDSLDVVDECVFQDVEPPAVFCPANMTRLTPHDICAPNQITLGDVTALATITDNCPNPLVVTQDPPAETVLGPGTAQVTITATDQAGNVAQCTTALNVINPTAGMCGICCGAGFVEAFLVTCGSLAGRKLSRRRYRP